MAFIVRHSGPYEDGGVYYLLLQAETADDLLHFKKGERVDLLGDEPEEEEALVPAVKDANKSAQNKKPKPSTKS